MRVRNLCMTQLGKYSVESGVRKFEMHRYELIIFWSEEDGR